MLIDLLNIWEFVYFCLGSTSSETPCCTMAKFCTQTCTDHVQNIYWVLCLNGSSLPKKRHF